MKDITAPPLDRFFYGMLCFFTFGGAYLIKIIIVNALIEVKIREYAIEQKYKDEILSKTNA